ncbi:hypothetical protein [Amycolatopsis pigmentata]|uniref:Uncharacterized protein n=1 Tax=Amycolatopsis pigmentata TaxID=450801 RepID=A0ABW5G0Y7_9PSEU
MSVLAVRTRLRRLLAGFREFHDEQVELIERQALLNRPWEEEFLHWGLDGRLHGRLVPPRRRHVATTRSGWCTGLRASE